MNSDRGRRKEVEMKEQETKRILEKKKTKKKRKKDWTENQRERK